MLAVAWATSGDAWGLGEPSWSKCVLATETIRTGACWAQVILPSTRQLSSRLNSFGSSFVATMKLQGCSLKQEAAQRAASQRLRNVSGATACSENARGLHRRRNRS